MKSILTKIASLTLALLMLFSTFSFTVEKHYCGDFLVDVSFTGETEGCGMVMAKNQPSKKKNCCKDEVHQIDGQDELQHHKVDSITFENQQFLVALVVFHNALFVENKSNTTFYKDFSPPDIPKDYQILFQSFLI